MQNLSMHRQSNVDHSNKYVIWKADVSRQGLTQVSILFVCACNK